MTRIEFAKRMWRHRPPHAVQLMLIMLLCMALLLTVTVKAFAQSPSEDQKKEALMRAYVANGNGMAGWNSFDATAPRVVKTDRIVPVEPKPGAEKPPAVKAAAADVCTRHGKRKVVRGRSWRCR